MVAVAARGPGRPIRLRTAMVLDPKEIRGSSFGLFAI
jgi:hypothetical protein